MNFNIINKDKIIGGLIGLSIGDALGVPVEFKQRHYLKDNPIKDFIGYGTHNQPPGTWSDDSSLAFCLAESLCLGFNINDIAQRFIQWMYEGYWTAHGKTFDVGKTTFDAIKRMHEGINPIEAGSCDEYSNGNGSLMRILPLAFYVAQFDTFTQFELTHKVSCLTHRHVRSQMACGIYVQYVIRLLHGDSPTEAYMRTKNIVKEFYSQQPYISQLHHFERILKHDISKFPEDSINSSGYVVDTLEASLWCFLHTTSFTDAVLTAVNLGEDTDTTGAVTGGLAGVYYGYHAIPKKFVDNLAKAVQIIELGNRLHEALCAQCSNSSSQ